jgi:hypothetical protein
MTLTVERIGPGQYRVSGGDEPHYVNLAEIDVPMCDCAHHIWRDAICRHIKAARAFQNPAS